MQEATKLSESEIKTNNQAVIEMLTHIAENKNMKR